jgi:hypothetical protein
LFLSVGQSGGPFFAWWDTEPWPRVVGVQRAGKIRQEWRKRCATGPVRAAFKAEPAGVAEHRLALPALQGARRKSPLGHRQPQRLRLSVQGPAMSRYVQRSRRPARSQSFSRPFSDPVRAGVNTLHRPGGNVTGATFMGIELVAKRLELLSEAPPRRAEKAGPEGGAGSDFLRAPGGGAFLTSGTGNADFRPRS